MMRYEPGNAQGRGLDQRASAETVMKLASTEHRCDAFLTPRLGQSTPRYEQTKGVCTTRGLRRSRLGRRRSSELFLVGLLFLASVSVYVQPSHALPTANFNFTPASPVPGEAVSFDGSASIGTGHTWDFDDSICTPQPGCNRASGVTASHTYGTTGTHDVTLTVGDGQGAVASLTVPVVVASVNQSPTASFSYTPPRPVKLISVTFDATNSSDPDGTIVSYGWDFGDGSKNVTSLPVISHVFLDNDPNPIATLTVMDDRNATHSLSKEVDVRGRNDLPIANMTLTPTTMFVGDKVFLNGTASRDPDGVYNLSFHWQFGDGTTDTKANTTTHRYQSSGTFNATLVVIDDSGGNSSITRQAQVLPGLIVAISSDTAEGKAPLLVWFNAQASGGQAPYYFAWNFGDDELATAQSPPHNYTALGSYQVQVIVADSAGHIAFDSVIITVTDGAEGPEGLLDFGPIPVHFVLNGIEVAALGMSVSLVVYGYALHRVRRQQKPGRNKLNSATRRGGSSTTNVVAVQRSESHPWVC